jgi:succinyl-diaminopimelate desuccinylase
MLDQILKLSREFIAVPSTKDNPEKLKEVLDLALKQIPDIDFTRYENHGIPSLLMYNNWPKDGKFKIIMNAHLDVVPAKPEQYTVQIDGDKMIGRGAVDMKAAGAAELLAFKENAPKVSYPLALQLVTDEEIGGHNGVKYQISQGILSDFYLCGEFSDLGLGLDTKGVLWVKMITHGARAHGAFLWNGVNAITKLADEIKSVKRLFPVPKQAAWRTTCNFGVTGGGDTVNQVPDQAYVILDIRHIAADLSADLISKIKARLVYPDTELEIIEDEPVNHADRQNPLVKLLAASVKSVTGRKAAFVKFHGASDARHYSAVGTTALDIGPAGDGLHSDYEWVSIDSLEKYYRVLNHFLQSIK